MEISPDFIVYWKHGPLVLNATIVFTWLVIALLVTLCRLTTRKLHTDEQLPRWQNMLEIIVMTVMDQIRAVTRKDPRRFLPFLGSLFLFIALSNLLAVVPWFEAPTGSLSTTTALALCVFVAVPLYGIADGGLVRYLRNYVKPSPVMLPFNIMGEISRTLALAVRLFGNIMSGSMIAAVLLAITPLVFPVTMHLLGLLTGMVQAYIFFILAAVYIAAGLTAHEKDQNK